MCQSTPSLVGCLTTLQIRGTVPLPTINSKQSHDVGVIGRSAESCGEQLSSILRPEDIKVKTALVSMKLVLRSMFEADRRLDSTRIIRRLLTQLLSDLY